MLLRPFRLSPTMFGGVGFPARMTVPQRATVAPPAPRDVVQQLRDLKALQDEGVLSAEEFELAKRKVLDG